MSSEKLGLLIAVTVVALLLSAPGIVRRLAGHPVPAPRVLYPTPVPTPTAAPVYRPKPTEPPIVTLQGFGGGPVQMFGALTADADVVATFAAGTECYQLDGPISVEVEGIRMSFHRLNCDKQPGYVNAQWVR